MAWMCMMTHGGASGVLGVSLDTIRRYACVLHTTGSVV